MAGTSLTEADAGVGREPGDRPPHVLFLLPGLMLGGAERHAIDLLQRLRRRGFPVSLVSHGRRGTPEMEAIAQREGAVVLGLKGMSSLRGWFATRRELARHDADVVFCVNQSVAVVALILRRLGLLRSRVICVFHTTVLEPEDRARFFLFRWTARWLDRLVFLSARHQTYWEADGLSTPHPVVIENGIDLDYFDASRVPPLNVRKTYGLDRETYLIGIVAGLRREKNHLELIRAAARLDARGVRSTVLIIGDGDTRAEIEAEARAAGIWDSVVFAGTQSDVRPYVVACDVCVLCSSTETFSLATLEILALGSPMVSSIVGAQEDIIEHGVNGLLYRSGDVEALADALWRIRDPVFRESLARNARPSVLRYGVEPMVDRYDHLIRQVATDPSRPSSGKAARRVPRPAEKLISIVSPEMPIARATFRGG